MRKILSAFLLGLLLVSPCFSAGFEAQIETQYVASATNQLTFAWTNRFNAVTMDSILINFSGNIAYTASIYAVKLAGPVKGTALVDTASSASSADVVWTADRSIPLGKGDGVRVVITMATNYVTKLWMNNLTRE